jgi:hypothetical protein
VRMAFEVWAGMDIYRVTFAVTRGLDQLSCIFIRCRSVTPCSRSPSTPLPIFVVGSTDHTVTIWGIRQMLPLAHAWRFALFPLKFTIRFIWFLSCIVRRNISNAFSFVCKTYDICTKVPDIRCIRKEKWNFVSDKTEHKYP